MILQMVLQMLVFQHSLQHEYDKPGRAVASSCVCIPPSGPSYVRTLTPRGTMVDSHYPTRLSPPSEPYSEALNPVSHKNGRGWMVGYRPWRPSSFPRRIQAGTRRSCSTSSWITTMSVWSLRSSRKVLFFRNHLTDLNCLLINMSWIIHPIYG